MFKVGDIVECLKDRPYGAGIKVGGLAVILKINKQDDILFDNWPKQGYMWSGYPKDFVLHSVDLENK